MIVKIKFTVAKYDLTTCNFEPWIRLKKHVMEIFMKGVCMLHKKLNIGVINNYQCYSNNECGNSVWENLNSSPINELL